MANLLRMRVLWSGSAVVGGGVSTFYFTDGATGMTADVEEFFDGIKFALATGVTIRIPDGGDVIDDTDGSLAGIWGSGSGVTVLGSGSGDYAMGVGARVRWGTAGVNNGRRVRGSTFLVPLAVGAYDADGSLDTSTLGVMQAAADVLVTEQASAFTIYSRSIDGGAGGNHEVTSATVPDTVSWLRSRRT